MIVDIFGVGKEPAKQKNPNTDKEQKFASSVILNQETAESGIRTSDVEPHWEDEYLAFKGDQWDTSLAPRSAGARSKRPNTVLNVILPTVMNIVDALTTSTPEAEITGRELNDKQVALKISDLISFVFYRNCFSKEWRDIVTQGIKYGPFIGYVGWDPKYTGGSGPKKFVGEIITKCQSKDEIYFDPAILDLENRLQECEFIHRKYRKKITYIEDTWENGKYIIQDNDYDRDNGDNEGPDPRQATLIEAWHKRKPQFVSDEYKKEFKKKAADARKTGNNDKADDYEAMADGTLDGVHCAYVCGTVLLEYIPYVFEDGLYPFAYAVS